MLADLPEGRHGGRPPVQGDGQGHVDGQTPFRHGEGWGGAGGLRMGLYLAEPLGLWGDYETAVLVKEGLPATATASSVAVFPLSSRQERLRESMAVPAVRSKRPLTCYAQGSPL